MEIFGFQGNLRIQILFFQPLHRHSGKLLCLDLRPGLK